MARRVSIVLAFAACLVVFPPGDSEAQPVGATAPVANGLRIVKRSELRPTPGASDASGEIARTLAARRASVPPDGIARSTIYAKGSAVRIEHTAPDSLVTVCPADSKMCYSINAREKTFSKYRARLGSAGWEIEKKRTGASETIASLPSEEVRYVARVVTAGPIPTPPPPANRNDGYSDADATSRPYSTVYGTMESGIVRNGRVWLASLPPGGDARKLAAVLLGQMEPVAGGRFPVKHVLQFQPRGAAAGIELHETVESIESVPLDDGLFQLPAGFREVPLRRLAR